MSDGLYDRPNATGPWWHEPSMRLFWCWLGPGLVLYLNPLGNHGLEQPSLTVETIPDELIGSWRRGVPETDETISPVGEPESAQMGMAEWAAAVCEKRAATHTTTALRQEAQKCADQIRHAFRAIEDTAAAVHGDYGRCPRCRAFGVERERRLGGNDKCQNGHVYPSSEAVPDPPEQITADTDRPRSSSDLAKGMDVLDNLAAKDKRIRELESELHEAETNTRAGEIIVDVLTTELAALKQRLPRWVKGVTEETRRPDCVYYYKDSKGLLPFPPASRCFADAEYLEVPLPEKETSE